MAVRPPRPPMGLRPLGQRMPTDAEYRALHERREAEREIECYCAGKPFRYQPFNRRDWPPYPHRSGVTVKE